MKVSDAKYAVGLNTRCSVLGDWGLSLNKLMPICTAMGTACQDYVEFNIIRVIPKT